MGYIKFEILIDKSDIPGELKMAVTGNTGKDLLVKMDSAGQCGDALRNLGISLQRHFDKDLRLDFEDYIRG